MVGTCAQHAGRPDHDLVDAGEADLRLLDETICSLPKLRDNRLGGTARSPCRGAADHSPGDIAQRRAHPFAPDVEAQHPPGARVDVVELRARARATAGPPDLAEQAEIHELAQDL